MSYKESYEILNYQIGTGEYGVVEDAESKKKKDLNICVKKL